MALAHRLRFPSIRHMKAALTGREILDWLIHFKLEAEEREERRLQNLLINAAQNDLNRMKHED